MYTDSTLFSLGTSSLSFARKFGCLTCAWAQQPQEQCYLILPVCTNTNSQQLHYSNITCKNEQFFSKLGPDHTQTLFNVRR